MLSQRLKDLIASWEWTGREGLREDGMYLPYDVNGVPHIGIGHRNDLEATQYVALTREGVEQLFEWDLLEAEDDVKKGLGAGFYATLSENQRIAIIDFAFNTGGESSSLYNMLKYNNEAARAWWESHYVSAKGDDLDVLKRRRLWETSLYFNDLPQSSGVLSAVLIAALVYFLVT